MHIQDRADNTEQTGQRRQDSADRTAQTGENKQARTTRIRKTGRENLVILSAHFSADNFLSFFLFTAEA
jgi:hypothetical protein